MTSSRSSGPGSAEPSLPRTQVDRVQYHFVPARSRAIVTAQAPGHRFRVEGSGVEGTVELEGDRVLGATARFPLDALHAGDPLGTHELRKFLAGEKQARAELLGPIVLGRDGPARFTIGARAMDVRVRLSGSPGDARASFQLSFSGLGYPPPKLLFFKVKDTLEVEISAVLEKIDV